MPKAQLHKRVEAYHFSLEDGEAYTTGQKRKSHHPYFFKPIIMYDQSDLTEANLECLEAFAGDIWRWMLGPRASKARPLYTSNDHLEAMASKAIPNYQSINELYRLGQYRWLRAALHPDHSDFMSLKAALTVGLLALLQATTQDLKFRQIKKSFQWTRKNLPKKDNLNKPGYIEGLMQVMEKVVFKDTDPSLTRCNDAMDHESNTPLDSFLAILGLGEKECHFDILKSIAPYVPYINESDLVRYNFAAVIVSAYVLEEVDLHPGNFGFSSTLGGFVKIDHNRSLAQILIKLDPKRFEIYDVCKLDLNANDIDTLPNLFHGNFYHWPAIGHTLEDKEKNGPRNHTNLEMPAFANIAENTTFRRQCYLEMTRFLLLPLSSVMHAAKLHLEGDFIELVYRFIAMKQLQLIQILCKVPSYHIFISNMTSSELESLQEGSEWFFKQKHFRHLASSFRLQKSLGQLRQRLQTSVKDDGSHAFLQAISQVNHLKTNQASTESSSSDSSPPTNNPEGMSKTLTKRRKGLTFMSTPPEVNLMTDSPDKPSHKSDDFLNLFKEADHFIGGILGSFC